MAVSGFYYPIHGVISEQVDQANGNAFFANAGSLDLRGFDFALSRSVPGGLEGTVSYSFQDATNSAHTPVPNAPKHVVQASLSVPLIGQKIFASMDLQFVSTRTTLAGPDTGAYVVPNFTLFTRNVLERWEVSVSLYNAFNQIYADPVGNGLAENVIVQDGRTFRIKVGYKLR
jgi:iron complex outermembrane receptor protein